VLSGLVVVVMAKLPQAGLVKTRLVGRLTPEQAAQVHRALLLHISGRLGRLYSSELVICHHPSDAGPAMRALLLEACPEASYLPQGGGNLGSRLAAAHAELARRGCVLFLGSDSPDVPAEHLNRAAELTRQADVTIGPTDDGGYWCLGLSARVDALELLSRIDWSSGSEADQTSRRARELGYTLSQAPLWDDVDRPADLERLLGRLRRSDDPESRRLADRLDFLE
jgi:hypothetical protein